MRQERNLGAKCTFATVFFCACTFSAASECAIWEVLSQRSMVGAIIYFGAGSIDPLISYFWVLGYAFRPFWLGILSTNRPESKF